tara:strand:+ start:3965 stop:4273 length:309 start_codon:yes stop_codon:yes gene_type:complete
LIKNKNQFFYRKGIWKMMILLISSQFFFNNDISPQESNKLNDIEINSTTKSTGNDNSVIPSNPFELVDMIRRINSMNDATNPTDAIDDALKSFNMIKDESKI